VHEQLAAFNRSRITPPAEHIVLVRGERYLYQWPNDGFVEAAAAIAGYSGSGTAFLMADADVASAQFVADYTGDSTHFTVVGSAVMQPVAGISGLPVNVSSSHAQLTVAPSGPTSITTAWDGASDGLRTRITGDDAPGFLSVFETEPAPTAFSAASHIGSIEVMTTVETGATVTVDLPDIGDAAASDIIVTAAGIVVPDCAGVTAVCVAERRVGDGKFDASVDLRFGWPLPPALFAFDAVPRMAGSNRYETAVAVVSNHFPTADRVYLATGEDFADALSAAAAAGRVGAPVLLTRPEALPQVIADELVRLSAKDVVIVGGPNAVFPAVADQVANLPTRPQVSRIEGADRYATAAAVSSATFAPGASRAFVATGLEFPDALAGTLPAIFTGGPVLLVRPDSIPDTTRTELARLRPEVVVVLGGPRAVSESVRAELGAVRVSGQTRYETAVAISAASHPDASSPVVYVATGDKYPDALSGGPAAAQGRDTLLLVPTDGDVPEVVLDEIRRLGASELVILGGDQAVRPASVARLAAALT
jgi:putative cell wall-binding protein